MDQELTNLEDLLDCIRTAAGDTDRVSLGVIVAAVGSRAFGPLLALVGIILASPLSGIPGMPTTMGLFVLLIAVQLLVRRKRFWLPRWLLSRSVARVNLDKALNWLWYPATFIDRRSKQRLVFFIRGVGNYIVSTICIVIAVCLPLMEIIPFSATSAGVILTIFGLSLIAHDGVMALIALMLTGIVFIFIANYLL